MRTRNKKEREINKERKTEKRNKTLIERAKESKEEHSEREGRDKAA